TTFSDNIDFKKSITDFAERIYASKVESLFQDFKKLGSSFLCKSPGAESKMPVHQDWTVVDESKYYSVTIWVPLVDTDESNGAIRVLRGSHKFTSTLRSPNMPGEYENVRDEIWNAMETLPLRAGEAFIFNHALIHASSPNTTSRERLAITYGLVPKEAQLFLYLKNESGRVEKYKMPDDMFPRYHNIGQRPSFGEKLEEFDYAVKQVSSLKLHHLLTKSRRERNMKPLFRDPAVQEFFEREGYVKLKMLDEKEVQELLDYYYSLQMKDETGYGFHISMDNKDKAFVSRVLDKIFEVALPKIAPHFQNAKAYVGSFVIKEPNPKGVVPVHQDWTFVEDEDHYCSVTCWVPLVDTTLDSGALGVIRGSHTFFTNYRPSPSPQTPAPLAEHMFTIFPYLQLIEMKAGEALVFDNRTFHGSPPNTTGKPRIAFGIGFVQQDARLTHYYLKPDGKKNTLLKYKIDEGFFRKYENATLSRMYDNGKLIEGYELEGEVPYVLPKFTSDELFELVKEHGNEFNVPMCEKLAKLFGYNMDGTRKEEPQQPEALPQTQPERAEEKAEAAHNGSRETAWTDDRKFFQKYTPLNILREVKKRVMPAQKFT
ncbi:MAG TPA: phytanoyl-CoA dioxygenase family protein, partial [Chitinophagales bacterium]|nr:phytanoyl-CoA dioxygenase family protein [Chitinophagales bacterium]